MARTKVADGTPARNEPGWWAGLVRRGCSRCYFFRRVGGGEELRAGGELREGPRDGAARGGVDRLGGEDRVVERGGLTVRDGVVDRGGATVRDGVRRSRLPDDGLMVRPEPTEPWTGRVGLSPTRRGTTCRTPEGSVVRGPSVRRPSSAPVTVRPGGVISRPRRGAEPVVAGDRVSPMVRRPSAPLGFPADVPLVGAGDRPRPLIVGSTVAGAASVVRRRASSVPGVFGDDTGELAAAVRRVGDVTVVRAGEDAYVAPVPVVRRRAVTDCGFSP